LLLQSLLVLVLQLLNYY